MIRLWVFTFALVLSGCGCWKAEQEPGDCKKIFDLDPVG